MIRVVLVAHHGRADARELATTTAAWLRGRGHQAWMPAADAHEMGLDELASDESPGTADLALSLGGDGTMLRAVDVLDGADVPLLGVNLGRLGYLTEVEPEGIVDALQRFEQGADAGAWQLDTRMMLAVSATGPDGTVVGSWRALNEAVVEKRASGQTVHLLLRIDGDPFTSFAADGLIVSTPTGSTAYSLSARGPVVSPKHRALLVTPVAPHQLFDRSMVLDPTELVEIEVVGDREAAVVVDGRDVGALPAGSIVVCRPSDRTAKFIRLGDHRYHRVLHQKFNL